MKLKKALSLILAAAAGCTVLAIAGCGEEGGTNGGEGANGVKTYTLEAEYIDLDDVQGAGISSDQGGVEMIYGQGTEADKNKGWSSGYYVGYTYSANLQLDFVFESDKDATAAIVLRLGSELGALSLDPTSFAVKLNGVALDYQAMYIETSTMDQMKFYDKTVTSNAQLKAGTNTISLVVLPNTFKNGSSGGPMVDCVKLETAATVTWSPKTENPSNRGGGPF